MPAKWAPAQAQAHDTISKTIESEENKYMNISAKVMKHCVFARLVHLFNNILCCPQDINEKRCVSAIFFMLLNFFRRGCWSCCRCCRWMCYVYTVCVCGPYKFLHISYASVEIPFTFGCSSDTFFSATFFRCSKISNIACIHKHTNCIYSFVYIDTQYISIECRFKLEKWYHSTALLFSENSWTDSRV